MIEYEGKKMINNYIFELKKDEPKELTIVRGMRTKFKVLFLTNQYLLIKVQGSTQYVHRGVGNMYGKAEYQLFKIEKVLNFKDRVHIFAKLETVSYVKEDHLNNFLIGIGEGEEYDPLYLYSPSEREQILREKERQNKLMMELERKINE